MLSTMFGIGVFLALLGFSAHLLLNLWVISTVDDIAQRAAIEVAVSGSDDSGLPNAESRALDHARALLGRWAPKVSLEFEDDPTGGNVILHVRSSTLRLMPTFGRFDPGPPPLDRRIVVHRELPAP